jgi:hypothetical protein
MCAKTALFVKRKKKGFGNSFIQDEFLSVVVIRRSVMQFNAAPWFLIFYGLMGIILLLVDKMIFVAAVGLLQTSAI